MISVITITYNNISELKKTVNSVIKFSSLNGSLIKELVIVDNLLLMYLKLYSRII